MALEEVIGMSDLFKKVKNSVTAKEVAVKYGMQFGKNGLAYCPFHQDSSASMIVDERYYCFGCGATGDAIDLAAKILNLKVKDAALKLREDFSLQKKADYHQVITTPPKEIEAERSMTKIIVALSDYRNLLEKWKTLYAPKITDTEWHPLFCEALWKIDYVEYLLDELLECNPEDYEKYAETIKDQRLWQINTSIV